MLFGWFGQPDVSHNDGSRWAVVHSVVHDGDYNIYGSPFYTIDHIVREIDEKLVYFSRKASFLPNIGATLYLPLHALGVEVSPRTPNIGIFIILSVINLLPFLVMLYFYFLYLDSFELSRAQRLFCGVTVSMGTYLTGYLWVFNNHLPAAFCVFFSLLFMAKIFQSASPDKGWYWACLGFAAFAPCFDLVSAAYFPCCFAALFFRAKRHTVVAGTVALLFSSLTCCFSEYIATGLFLPYKFYYLLSQHVPGYVERLDPFRNPAGMQLLAESKFVYTLHVLWGHHGYFSLTPVLLAAAFGLRIRCSYCWQSVLSAVTVATFVPATFILIFKTRNYGGLCQGFRWLFWGIPFWLMLLPFAVRKFEADRPKFWIPAILVVGVSVFSILTALPRPFAVSWLHQLIRSAQLVDY